MKNKKITVITKYFYPIQAGIEVSILQTYSLLAERGWEITVHTTNKTFNSKEKLNQFETYKNIKIVRHSFINFLFSSHYWIDSSIISIHNFNILPHIYILLRIYFDNLLGNKSYKVILTPHGGLTPDWKTFNPIHSFFKKFIQHSIGRLVISTSVDYVRAVSDWEKDEIINFGISKNKVFTISNGLEKEAMMNVEKLASKKIKVKVKKFKKYFIQIGRINKIKNYETSIKALTFLPQDINFVILGPIQDYQYEKYLRKLVIDLNLNKRVFFLDPLTGIDKYYLLKNSLLLVHMSRLESFCNVVLEAMSQSLVCLVSNRGALPYLIKNKKNGFVVEVDNFRDLAKKILYTINNKNNTIIKNMQRINHSFAINNSWGNVADLLESKYLSI